MADMENETEIAEGGWSKEGTGPLLDVMKGMPAVVLDTAVLTEHLLVKAVGASEETFHKPCCKEVLPCSGSRTNTCLGMASTQA